MARNSITALPRELRTQAARQPSASPASAGACGGNLATPAASAGPAAASTEPAAARHPLACAPIAGCGARVAARSCSKMYASSFDGPGCIGITWRMMYEMLK